ncbi:RNA helicase HrpA [Alkalispirochaeta americana]|uniref:RNA helicase n=1 Tax=Alkalispirochaeta americana TaxID=159291 RepID=A0A1N6VL29_9SPIO|nr:ATP-dependent RNA helicase [Alkalispirochaeta americana]SIQ78562.1 RNA helicase HrpA [Alkalispirochaeta americana]
MKSTDLPVYQQRERILKALQDHRVVVVESPTGSGKTTQLPIILHEAGYAAQGVIGITQPRRIAAVSVSAFVARQLESPMPGLVGYKMRFDDHTTPETRIKIMTDGILLQEIKADQHLSEYSVIMVDEAHERSLNIDFVLGLLKRALTLREDLRVIVSSATINTTVFSEYFDSCPVVSIDTPMYPVQVIYDDPLGPALRANLHQERSFREDREEPRSLREASYDARLNQITDIVARVMEEEETPGDFLIFLPGEQMIKDCITRLYSQPFHGNLQILPLYGRLSKEEQDAVFPPPPEGKTKVVVATNIAETSITINGVTLVIDSGLAKTNHYNPRTYTSALIEGPIARAGADQRKGRAGRTQPGRCYRLYSKQDYENRPLFPEDEIYRTDLSEVVLRMAELGIRDFENFDFISSPGRGNILGAVETLRLLDAIDDTRELTTTGRMMAVFPLLPRHSRIILEAINRFPQVLEEVITAVAFLTSATPFILPPGEEVEARQAHHRYRDELGDFVSYLRLFAGYQDARNPTAFCQSRYLDPRTMAEIVNVQKQLKEIVSDMDIPVLAGGPRSDYLTAIGRGLIQFVCIHTGRGVYQSLTAERIQIHPGSGLFRESPPFIVAGEIVRTSKTYARSVSPLRKEWVRKISEDLYRGLCTEIAGGGKKKARSDENHPGEKRSASRRDTTWQIQLGEHTIPLKPYKGKKKIACIPYDTLTALGRKGETIPRESSTGAVRVRVELGKHSLLEGLKLSTLLRIAPYLPASPKICASWPGKDALEMPEKAPELLRFLENILALAPVKRSHHQLGFIALYCSRDSHYWFKPNRGFLNAVAESLASLEQLIDELQEASCPPGQIEKVSALYRRLSQILEQV